MDTIARYTEYDPFARVYNRHWGEKTLRQFPPVLDALLVPALMPGVRVLDVCCGTGQLARWLTDRGFSVTGLDGSAAMLRFARENAPDAEFILADAREFALPPLFTAACSTFDSLNHVSSLEELTAVFHNIHGALLPGGRFLFDLNVREGYLESWHGTFSVVEEDHAFITRAHYDDAARLARLDLTIFHRDGEWRRTDLTLTQHCFEEADVISALWEAGFTDIQLFDANRCPKNLTLPKGRTFFLGSKEQQ